MALRISKALRNFVNNGGSLRQALNGGKIEMRTGAQPASADDADAGSLLVTFTKSGSAYTNEVYGTATVQVASGASGQISSLKMNAVELLSGVVAFDTSLTNTATALALALNRSPCNINWKASSSGTVVTLTARPGLGANVNGLVTTGTATTLSLTHGTVAGGVTPANGLNWEVSTTGTMVKRADETWSGTAIVDGTAGWFRWKCGVTDAGSADAAEALMRLDGSVASSGAQLNGATNIVLGGVQTITADQIIIPAA
jgi:hypothetical protein